MRWTLLLLGASVASASLKEILADLSPSLPLSSFGKFHTISLEDVKKGKDLIGKLIRPPLDPSPNPKLSPDPNPSPKLSPSEPTEPTFQTLAAGCAGRTNMRTEWRRTSHDDRLAFLNAVKCLMNRPPSGRFSSATNRYEDFARLHQQKLSEIHQNDMFLVWHRYFVWTFEQVLRDECGFNRNYPWWDETKDAGHFAQAPVFTRDYFGSLPGPRNGQGVCITDGVFAGITCNIGPGLSNRPHCLSRAVNEAQTAQCNNDFVIACNQRTNYAAMHSCAETGPHGYGHNGIGSVMMDVAGSPSDPIFFMHHAFIDRNFRVWQNEAQARWTTINGVDSHGTPLTLDTVISVAGIRPDVRIRQILDTLGGASIGGVPFCYRYDY
ncbi:conserved hypothetical protein [Histoplasma capsulatum G186AR]|uniref:Tyrosinase copper-binding domain-containing protein n=2 Tax=Ajellomyces capsulatus TaxID=5037 RepID=C0NAT6_AJECG|nr:uncharacterized protein HCBG_00232 [Histoplasma capsulatum G186AR]EEH10777.1 conserved hypothetical protein [Histoplasma capsulatum G186AR]KAG5288657.1 tyrosinase [Histoplasma capsulatum]QSS71232.1 tyrosinase [Histoplasma capsulatum G186AR]